MRATLLISLSVLLCVNATEETDRHRKHRSNGEHHRSEQLERIGFYESFATEPFAAELDDRHRLTVRQTRNNRVTDSVSTRNPLQEIDASVARKAQRGQYQENKNRPYFTKCEAASLKEGEPVNTFVTKVEARDNDTGVAGEVFYSIVRASNSEKQFEVDPADGTIRSSKIFDRDEPAREKIAYVTVKASDKGSPPLEALCTFNVTIVDINDNQPMFDKSSYEESVPRDAKLGNVMRVAATDIDFGENAHITYSLMAINKDDEGFFAINPKTGVITLEKQLTKNENYRFYLKAKATDNGTLPKWSDVDVFVTVASSTIKPPSFVNNPPERVTIPENYTSYKTPIATFEARSNIAEPDLYFELVKGQNQQTNSDETFKIFENGNTADVLVNKALDFETVSHYTLTVRVKNSAGVASETILDVEVTDVNDISPAFIEVDQGSVLENSPPNTFVLKIQATDRDGTYPNNLVHYDLNDFKDLFAIDHSTGEIRTLKELDREARRSYPLTVIAYDGAESALTLDGKPNEVRKRFQIEVADVNDNLPIFPKPSYDVEVAENADIGAKIAEIVALDNDTDSKLFYEIVDGNIGGVFDIDPTTGFLRVLSSLDYETRKAYTLTVEASDGVYKSSTRVNVKILNVNDNPPKFRNPNPMEISSIVEERLYKDQPIATIQAVDPDYDPETATGPSKITYSLSGENADSFSINDRGDLTIVKPLDRDKPHGAKEWYVFVVAEDELDGKTLQNFLEVKIILEDINDNAPFIDTTQPIVWYENQPPGRVTVLNVTDYDEPQNGAPFRLSMADSADPEVKASFRIEQKSGEWDLMALKTFDREERKEYAIPVSISDSGSPQQTGTSTLTVIIGDRNDNPMFNGSSSIFVYNYKGLLPDTIIGRAYVQDKDDWDLPDKVFTGSTVPEYFSVNRDGGNVTMRRGCPSGTYTLVVDVHDNFRNEDATATVRVQVKDIPEEAVIKSGSIRIKGLNQEAFVSSGGANQPSRNDILQEAIAKYVGAAKENVDVFTVVNWNSKAGVDVRFSAHGSPYYDPVRLNGILAANRESIASSLDADIFMFGINECLEGSSQCEGSCINKLEIKDAPYQVFTNTSSFVGVEARVVADCSCLSDSYPSSATSCAPDACLNGGTCTGNPEKPCTCKPGYEGPRCEGLSASFTGTGWAWYDPIPTCFSGSLSLSMMSTTSDGLILYAGPAGVPADDLVRDFVALELREGFPVAYVDLGSGTQRLELGMKTKSLSDGKPHELELSWQSGKIQLRVDQCRSSESWCMATATPSGDRKYFNSIGPLQVGGVTSDLTRIGRSLGWEFVPNDIGFSGCIQNLTFNKMFYDLYTPGYSKNHTASCDFLALPISAQGASLPLIIGLLVLLLLLLIIVIAIAVYRRRRSHETLKEFNDDIRENIINYSDEGGGEGDMTAYDLSVLRMASDGKPLMGDDYGTAKESEGIQRRAAPGEAPDLSAFLGDNKGRVDRDPDGFPFDELRHYAYEGEGNSNGSLSSLASGTDDGDLNFECLSDFGPRFKKLADMYGDNSSDESSSDAGDEDRHAAGGANNESWC